MTASATPEKMEFQTEVKQLLDLMIHSLYSHKEIFLRELISNASDALDKARFKSLTNLEVLGEDKTFSIRITSDPDGKKLTISDNGIGMTREEIIQNIGTIASSGTKEFVKRLTGDEKKDMNLIGQFGVGFYSVFMVAEKVTLLTKGLGSEEPGWKWESTGDGAYLLEEIEKPSRGTEITVHLREEEKEFAEDWRIRQIVKKYSEYIPHPIYLKDKEGKEEHLNDKPPIWKRPKSEITKEQYEEFYKHITFDQEPPFTWSHNQVEGTMEYTSLIFIPSKAPFDLYYPDKHHGLSLYVKRVFIMSDCKELVPPYLRFVRGIVDSEDLPLNVSRELLQQNTLVNKIQKATTKKVLNMLESMAKEKPEDYQKFWKEFGNVIKEGFHLNFENLDELKRLLRFQSSKTGKDEFVSLDEYIGRMKDGQKEIFYITGESRDAVNRSPHLEVFREKDIEVLYLIDPIDEWVVQSVTEFAEKKLASVTKGELDLGDLSKDEKKAEKESQSQFKDFNKDFQSNLSDRLKEVRITTRLKESPCCLVADSADMGANMERILKMANQAVPESKRILEINPNHAIIKGLKSKHEQNPQDPNLKEWFGILVDQALLAEGSDIKDPAGYVNKVNSMLVDVLQK